MFFYAEFMETESQNLVFICGILIIFLANYSKSDVQSFRTVAALTEKYADRLSVPGVSTFENVSAEQDPQNMQKNCPECYVRGESWPNISQKSGFGQTMNKNCESRLLYQ